MSLRLLRRSVAQLRLRAARRRALPRPRAAPLGYLHSSPTRAFGTCPAQTRAPRRCSVSHPIVRAVRWFHPKLSILHFDAHPDLYPEFEGDRYSHACPFARILEEKLVDQVVQVGIRTMNAVQRTQAERYEVEVIDMRAWVAGRRPTLREPVYLSIDIDAFDPAFAPGVSHREPGGLTAREVLSVLQGLTVPIVGADIVEFNPAQDPSGVTATLCAKLVKEIAGKMT